MQIMSNDTVKVIRTENFKHLNQRSRMVQGAVLDFVDCRVLVRNTYIFILISSLPVRSSQPGEACANEIKHDLHPE